MKRLWIFGTIAAVLALAGCSTTSAPTPEPSVAPKPNAAACKAFSEATFDMEKLLGENRVEGWEAVRIEFDTAALSAEGDVKERLAGLVQTWEPVSDVIIKPGGRQAFNTQMHDIARACDASGNPIDYATFAIN